MHVLWVVGGTGVLVFLEGILGILGELGDLLPQGDDEQRHRGWAGGEDEVLETLWFGHGEFCREHSSPRIPQKIEIFLDLEVPEEIIELVDEELDGPELYVTLLFGDMGRHSTADLVVEDDGDLVLGPEIGEGEHVIVDDAWASVEDHQGAMFPVGEVPVDLVPGLGDLPGARHGEVDLASDEAFSGHGSSRRVVGERGKPPADRYQPFIYPSIDVSDLVGVIIQWLINDLLPGGGIQWEVFRRTVVVTMVVMISSSWFSDELKLYVVSLEV